MRLSEAGAKILAAMLKASDGCVYAGWNPGGPNVSANALTTLAKAGLVEVAKTSAGETFGRITKAGVEAAS